MQRIQISKFKATCLAVLDRVAQTREPVLVTRRGKPIARIVPPAPSPAGRWLASSSEDGARIYTDEASAYSGLHSGARS